MSAKIKPLFRNGDSNGCASTQEMMFFLDLPEHGTEKRAFMNHLAVCPACQGRWLSLRQWITAGSRLEVSEPDPSIRANVLDAAYHASRPLLDQLVQGVQNLSWGLPGWRLAWAALFVLLLYGLTPSFPTSTTPSIYSDDMILELDTIAEQIYYVQEEMAYTLELPTDV